MKLKVGLILLFALVVGLLSLPAIRVLRTKERPFVILPAPKIAERLKGSFSLSADTGIVADESARSTAEYLGQRLRLATGFKIPITPPTDSSTPTPKMVIATIH